MLASLFIIARQTTYNKRYDESAPSAIASGVELCQDEKPEDETLQEGDLDVNLAELSLGQRLAAVSGGEQQLSGSDDDSDGEPKHTRPKHTTQGSVTTVPANSLTRTLIQALHSSDSRLLETCLTHSNAEVISNTVKRLPPQLAVPLIIACADRLGKGARSANMKGRGGGASTQRGSTLVAWIRIVLAAHSGHLMTVCYMEIPLAIPPDTFTRFLIWSPDSQDCTRHLPVDCPCRRACFL